MSIQILGPHPLERDAQGWPRSRIATIFPKRRLLVTLPGIHTSQRLVLLDQINEDRRKKGLPDLTPDEEEQECIQSVDLILHRENIEIRPDPDHMNLAFDADELLQELVSKRRIKFLFVWNEKVQRAIKERGESWRISGLPQSHQDMRQMIDQSRVGIREEPIYYYNRITGTRYLTYQEFSRLESLGTEALARQLQEIADHSWCRNRLGNPEVDFFATDHLRFGARDFARLRFIDMPEPELRAKFRELKSLFEAAVEPGFRSDSSLIETWRNRMFSVLISQRDEHAAEEVLRGLSPEFFMQIEWLPGGRIEEGELIFDSIFDEAEQHRDDPELRRLCDPLAKGFIFNFIREYAHLEYVNVGRVATSLSVRRKQAGRRDVYIAELKVKEAPEPIVRFIRLQKWGIRERLNEGKDLLRAMIETEEYSDYTLDRRLGCRQLGMNVPQRVTIRRVREVYHGSRPEFVGTVLRAPYFERDYIAGIATDKLPSWKYANEAYALRFATLLGKAAASNMIVGRAIENGTRVLFDDGDEVVIEDSEEMPKDLWVGDHTGAFGAYQRPLVDFGKDYAVPVNSRLTLVPNPREFAEAYLAAFSSWFVHVQEDYCKRRRAFDTLFKHCEYDPAGSFSYRWECTLKRLGQSDASAIVESIRKQITVLASEKVT